MIVDEDLHVFLYEIQRAEGYKDGYFIHHQSRELSCVDFADPIDLYNHATHYIEIAYPDVGDTVWQNLSPRLRAVYESRPIYDEQGFIYPDDLSIDARMVQDKDGREFTVDQAEQVNMAFAIKTGDLDGLEKQFFNDNLLESKVNKNYAVFKKVFTNILPHLPTESEEMNKNLCRLLGNAHRIHEVFYHWSWYMFPKVLEHFTSPEFLLEAATTVNVNEHVWQGVSDDLDHERSGRRPRPVMQLFWRWALFHNYQEKSFERLFYRVKSRGPDYVASFWQQFESEYKESVDSSRTEVSGLGFADQQLPVSPNSIKLNLPWNVFMNGSHVRFWPYLFNACKRVFGNPPAVFYKVLVSLAFYLPRKGRTLDMILTQLLERPENDAFKIQLLQTLGIYLTASNIVPEPFDVEFEMWE